MLPNGPGLAPARLRVPIRTCREEDMLTNREVGLWIDHRKAVVVAVTDGGDTTDLIVSKVEKQLGRFAGVRSREKYEAQMVPADDRQEHRFHGHLASYYDAVISSIGAAESVFIFGPGEAKMELKQRIEKGAKGGRAIDIAIETIDKMTSRQVVAKVRKHFTH